MGYKNRISLFNEYNYTLLINQSKVIDNATKFFNSTKDSLNQSVVLYNKAMQVKDEITSLFTKGGSIISNITSSFENIRQWINSTCYPDQTRVSGVSKFKELFVNATSRIDYLIDSNPLFTSSLAPLKGKISNSTQYLLSAYDPLDLCSSSITTLIDTIETYMNDTANFEAAE